MAFVCIDVGGTNTLIGIGNGDFEIKKRIKSKKFLKDIEKNVEKVIEKSKQSKEDIKQVIIAVAGPMDEETGIFHPPNLEERNMEQIQVKKPLEAFGKVEIINDCSSAVIGEYAYGGHKTENIVYITISSGIGAGIIADGDLILGADGNFGEIGHMEITNNEFKCGCGARGHWEAACSGNKMPEMAKKLYNADFKNSKQIFAKYQEGDDKAEKTIEKMQKINQKGIRNVVNLFNPEKIVLGGAVALNHPEKVIEPLKHKLEEQTVNKAPKIEKCALGEESVIQGLRAIANDKSCADKATKN